METDNYRGILTLALAGDDSTNLIVMLALALAGGVIVLAIIGVVAVFLNRSKEQDSHQASAHLHIYTNGNLIQSLPLSPHKTFTIGRGNGVEIHIDDQHISREHASIFFANQSWCIEDRNSQNGTFVNGRPIARYALERGDAIEIGPYQFSLQMERYNTETRRETSNLSQDAAPPIPAPPENLPQSRYRFGRFEFLQKLGEGGIARVWMAHDTTANQIVAVKQLTGRDDYLLKKFVQEGGLTLNHPHIARVIEANQIEGQPYILMEYVEGADLSQVLSGQPLPLDTALIIIAQILQALDYAHQRSIVHRDIKPDNIMISPHMGVKVIDFGIARVLSSVTRTQSGLIVGTPPYMSYEQAMGRPVNPTSDLYSTAIVLYELLTGRVPFSGENAMTIIRQHQEATPPPPRTFNADIPDHIEYALLRALEKDSSQRFQYALEFAEVLQCPHNTPLPTEFTNLVLPHIRRIPERALTPSPEQPVARTNSTLRVQTGTHQGKTISITDRNTVLGRAQLDPSDTLISREHFRLDFDSGQCRIVDMSRHGTIVNDSIHLQSGESCRLEPGMSIRVGQTRVIYEV
jgi:serine/threonine protein kinase